MFSDIIFYLNDAFILLQENSKHIFSHTKTVLNNPFYILKNLYNKSNSKIKCAIFISQHLCFFFTTLGRISFPHRWIRWRQLYVIQDKVQVYHRTCDSSLHPVINTLIMRVLKKLSLLQILCMLSEDRVSIQISN